MQKKGYITINKDVKPYEYSLNPAPIKLKSSKVLHYKAICDLYLEMRKWHLPIMFQVEPQLGPKGTVEPDAFTIWKDNPFFVEVQLTPGAEFVLPKYDKYLDYYRNGNWYKEAWQNKKKPLFPYVWILSNRQYSFPEDGPIEILQLKELETFGLAI